MNLNKSLGSDKRRAFQNLNQTRTQQSQDQTRTQQNQDQTRTRQNQDQTRTQQNQDQTRTQQNQDQTRTQQNQDQTRTQQNQDQTMEKVILLAVMSLGVISSQPITDSQRFFIAVSRVQHLHLLSQRFFSDFESSLGPEEQRQLNKVFLQDFCNSDYITSPLDKQETQRSSVLKLLQVSYRLVESWELPSRSLSALSRNQIPTKLSELKTGLLDLIMTNQEAAFREGNPVALGPFEDYNQRLSPDQSLRRSYELLACFKKDMHKVETYLMVAKCRLSPDSNCTL